MIPCPVTKGEHEWREGMGRDHGRYSCSRCMRCLHTSSLIHDERRGRELLARAHALLDLRDGPPLKLLAEIETHMGWDRPETATGEETKR